MLGESAREGGVFTRSGWAENGPGEPAVAFVAPCLEARVQGAAAALGMACSGHALCIAGCARRLKERLVLGPTDGGPDPVIPSRHAGYPQANPLTG